MNVKKCVAAIAVTVGMLFAKGEVSLPSGYTPIEYIQSTGAQYIKTGLKVSGSMTIDITYSHFQNVNNGTIFSNGHWSGKSYMWMFQGNFKLWGDPTIQVSLKEHPVADTDLYRLTWGAGDAYALYKNGTVVTNGVSGRTPIQQNELWIFKGSSGNCQYAQMRLYDLKIGTSAADGTVTLQRDYVPCRSPWNEVGLYDLVGKAFYGSASGTKFIGPYADSRLPNGYVPVEYVESDGSAFIDTGITAASDLSAELGYVPLELEGDGCFGISKDEAADWRFASYVNGCFFDSGSARAGNTSNGMKLQVGTRYVIKVGTSSSLIYNEVYDASGTSCLSRQTANKDGDPRPANVYLFGVNREGTPLCKKMRVYSFKLLRGGTLLRNFVPCRNLIGEAGLWDLVEGKFYGNFGLGSLTAPTNIPPPREVALPEGYTQVEWIESSGTQHIDTGYVPKRTTQVTASFKALKRNENWGAFFGTLNDDKSNNAISLRYYEGSYNLNGLFDNTSYGEAKTAGTYKYADVMATVREGAMIIDGTAHKISTSSDPYQGSLILFGERNGNEIRRRQSMRLYGLTIYEGTTVVHDYVPCRRESDGEYGLYDLTALAFLSNNGTGAFKGPDSAFYAKMNGDGFTYYTAYGESIAAPETGITGLPLAFANDAEYQALVAAPSRVALASGVVLEHDVTLTADADWSKYDFDFDFNYVGHTVNLNGHKLTVGKLKGEGSVTDTSVTTSYQLLSYLESDGNAYIDTGIIANFVISAELDYVPLVQEGDGSFGINKDENADYRFAPYSGGCFFDCGKSRAGVTSKGVILQAGTRYTVRVGTEGNTVYNEVFKEDGSAFGARQTAAKNGVGPRGVNIYLFGVNHEDKAICKKMRVYSFKLKNNGTLVRDFVPARRLPDGTLGLLDLTQAGGSFYVNRGGGSFTAGDAVGMRYYGAPCGELHVNVASGTIENTEVALSGSLKLVKDGNGTFVAHREGQTYFGGTQVTGGIFALWNSGQNATDWMPSTHGTLGALGSTIDVDSGARFNIVGNYDIYRFNIRLNSGQFESSDRPIQGVSGGSAFAQTQTGWAGTGNITLTADSKYWLRYDVIQNKGTVDLGGHTLDILFTNGKNLHWSSGIKNGTLIVHNGDTSAAGASWFKTIAAVDARTITFDMYEQFKLDNDFSVSNYVSHSRNDLTNGHQGTKALNVYGTFTPVTDFFYGCTMQDGSTIDLSPRTGAWSTTSLSTTGKRTVEFAKDATVYIDLGARRDAGDKGKIVAWTEKPENVTFALAKNVPGRLEVCDDGIYLRRGLTLFIR